MIYSGRDVRVDATLMGLSPVSHLLCWQFGKALNQLVLHKNVCPLLNYVSICFVYLDAIIIRIFRFFLCFQDRGDAAFICMWMKVHFKVEVTSKVWQISNTGTIAVAFSQYNRAKKQKGCCAQLGAGLQRRQVPLLGGRCGSWEVSPVLSVHFRTFGLYRRMLSPKNSPTGEQKKKSCWYEFITTYTHYSHVTFWWTCWMPLLP